MKKLVYFEYPPAPSFPRSRVWIGGVLHVYGAASPQEEARRWQRRRNREDLTRMGMMFCLALVMALIICLAIDRGWVPV